MHHIVSSRFMVFNIVSALLIPVLAFEVTAQEIDPSDVCDAAAQRAAAETQVPLDVLRAITRTETGRARDQSLEPWPWTVNMEGQGVWFDTETQARVYVFRHFKRGARSFDVGCFQINYRWHSSGFDSIEDMFDPVLNARYAATFLSKLFKEYHNWDQAVGAYHSRTKKYSKLYIAKYTAVRENLAAPRVPSNRVTPNLNRGSLVPQRPSPARSILRKVGG